MTTTTPSTDRLPPVVAVETEEAAWEAMRRLVAELVETGVVIETEWYYEHEPYLTTPLPHGPGVIFERGRVERVLRALGKLQQIKGTWARRPLTLFDWQVLYEIAPPFGLIDEATGFRIVRTQIGRASCRERVFRTV